MNIGVVLAGGSGQRFGGNTPKQYMLLNGKEVIAYAIEALKKSQTIDMVIVTCAAIDIEKLKSKYCIEAIEGGKSRNASIRRALDYIGKNYKCEKIIILDAVRPMVTHTIIDSYINLLDDNDSVITGQKIVDSIGKVNCHVLDRNDYYLIQAPEAFNYSLLSNWFDENSPITATNQQMPATAKQYVNFDFPINLKITYKKDLEYCANLMKEQD